MGATIQIRNVPEATLERLKARAASQGVALSEFLKAELERVAALPSPEEMRARLRRLARTKPAKLSQAESTAAIRAAREGR